MRNKILLGLCFLNFINTIFAQKTIVGTWLTSDEKSHISIFKQDNVFNGRVVWIKDSIDPATKKLWRDVNNPDTALRNRQVLGMIILSNFKYDSKKDAYIRGSFYYPREGKTYRGKIWLTNENTLQMRGYVWIFSSVDTWIRID